MSNLSEARARIPKAFKELFEHASYKGWYGGRGSAKSHSFARALILKGADKPLTILCCREIQLSIRDSVKRLLDQVIDELGLRGVYISTNNEIRCRNGTTFTFKGLRTGPESVKSTEGIDIVWPVTAHRRSRRQPRWGASWLLHPLAPTCGVNIGCETSPCLVLDSGRSLGFFVRLCVSRLT